MNNKIFKFMIVYTKSEERNKNFFETKNKIKDLKKFEAYDSINDLKGCLEINKLYNLNTERYINEWISKKLFGKIGCNLSHFMLLNMILNNSEISNDDWVLILEDDILINNYDDNIINELCKEADLFNSKYINLYVFKKFLEKQFSPQYLIKDSIYKMIPQWGTTSFLIKKSIIKILFDMLPCDCNIDIFYGRCINFFNSIVFKNDIFINMGSENSLENDTKFGSLIWNN